MKRIPTLKEYLRERRVWGMSEEEIKQAKKEYKRLYQREYKREKRTKLKELHPAFTKKEFKLIQDHAESYNFSPTELVKQAALAYLSRSYLTPQPESLAKIEQYLGKLYESISRLNTRPDLLTRIEETEKLVRQAFSKTQILEDAIIHRLKTNSSFRPRLYELIYTHQYDHQKPFHKK